jgi:hypothetical protein
MISPKIGFLCIDENWKTKNGNHEGQSRRVWSFVFSKRVRSFVLSGFSKHHIIGGEFYAIETNS